MLKPKPFTVGDIVVLKMTTGEEIIGSFDSEDDSRIALSVPLSLVMQRPQQAGMQPELGFTSHVMMAAKETIVYHKTAIMGVTRPSKEFDTEYRSMTSSIVTPPKGKLIV